MQGKKGLPFVTMGFPFKFVDGEQAIALMSQTAGEKKTTVLPSTTIAKLVHDLQEYGYNCQFCSINAGTNQCSVKS